ncbi:MAG: DUF177 domain-containing protein [Lentisphaerae bacterium]|nr:DUF177 domain-containing protein [Lentisphaerota bacterium]
MIIDVREIPATGKHFCGVASSAILEVDSEDIEVTDDLRYELVAHVISGRLIVKGSLGLKLRFRCSRCAEFYDAYVEEKAFFCDREVTKENESVDLTADMREAILLAFPAYPVCAPGCKGLCAQCGANLNISSCSCSRPDDRQWNALDGLNGFTSLKR